MYNLRDRGVAYAHVQINADKAGAYDFRIAADYFTYIHVNGKLAHTMLEGHGSPHTRVATSLELKKGINDLWLTVHAGSAGFGFLLELAKQEGVSVVQ